MKVFSLFILVFFRVFESFGQSENNIEANVNNGYQIFTGNGKKRTLNKMFATCAKGEFVFFGELHNEITAHKLELELTNFLFSKHGNKLILGAEMFESDNQTGLNAFLIGEVLADSIGKVVRIWPNHADYQPLLYFAKENKVPFIATNIPRRYASIVFKQGLDSLMRMDSSHLELICPLPFAMDTTLKSYKELLTFGTHGSTNFMMAQAIKDATMAYWISKNSPEESRFLHYNGSYHSNFEEGIVWHLKNYFPTSKIITIAVVTQESTKKLLKENKKLADFVIVLPTDSPKSYLD